MEADYIVFSFGSFFTSLGAIICSNKIKEALKNTSAKIIYIPNLVNQIETNNFVLEDYVDFIENKIERKIDRVLISNTKIRRKVMKRYIKEKIKITNEKALL